MNEPAGPDNLTAGASLEVPPSREQRDRLRTAARQYVQQARLVAPLSFKELGEHCVRLMSAERVEPGHLKYLAVLLSNELWRDALAAVPYDRRLLLLPKCLRHAEDCPAKMDELGLLCQQCMRCPIGLLKKRAEALGYVVLVAEGLPVVVSLIGSGRIEGIVGVSCLSSLERIFPCMDAASVPGVAIPLLKDGCLETELDIDWVTDTIDLLSIKAGGRANMFSIREQVDAWFSPQALEHVLGKPTNQTEQIAQQWLARSGKRWRPLLVACSYQAFQADPAAALPAGLAQVALAVECFHKASLIHDDIEDNDDVRYGQKTLHQEYGVPIALNVGDLLLGEGYRLIGQCDAPPARKAQMLTAAAEGHRSLCAGQGEELLWMREPRVLSVEQVLDIFRRKTAPAFEVALRLGAIYAQSSQDAWRVLSQFSAALGTAYQISDDLGDFSGNDEGSDLKAMRPSLLLAIAHQQARGEDRLLLDSAWQRKVEGAAGRESLRGLMDRLGVQRIAQEMLGQYKQEAIDVLASVEIASLKGMLRRVISVIFGDLKLQETHR